jgi:hypothetical protein
MFIELLNTGLSILNDLSDEEKPSGLVFTKTLTNFLRLIFGIGVPYYHSDKVFLRSSFVIKAPPP